MGVHVCIVYMGDCKDRASDTESPGVAAGR